MPPTATAASPAQREALRLLAAEIAPALRRAGRRSLATAVARAVAARDVGPLGRLPERSRRELLEFLEGHLPSGPGTARAVVTLTTVVAPLPSGPAGRGRRLTGPSR